MATIEVHFQPDGLRIQVEPGTLLADVMRTHGIRAQFPCGGAGKCGKCTVEIHPGAPEPRPEDRLFLTAEELGRGMRLACRTRVDRPMTVIVTPGTRALGGKILADTPVWQTLVPDDAAQPGISSGAKYGMAFDLGTTTVAGTLLDLTDGRELARASRMNPQAVHGQDVISRIRYAGDAADGRETLAREIRSAVNEIAAEAAAKAGITPRGIGETVFAGNTTMTTLFAGLDPSGLAEIPFAAETPKPRYAASELGLDVLPDGSAYPLPNIAGFVGSDTVAVMLAGGFSGPGPTRLAVDVGTNGELALRRSDGAIMVCSTAAGPALEGAALSCGMRAADGAVEHVRITDDGVACDVIGDVLPVGICGSGVIDAVAELLDRGIVDSSGRLLPRDELAGRIPESLLGRIGDMNGDTTFILCPRNGESGATRDVVITARDIRQVQLAKGAIAAGITLLLREMGVTPDDLGDILLAGAFGNYIRIRSAMRIGLLPRIPEERIKFVGNAALTGAKMALLSGTAREAAGRIAREARHLELAALPDFTGVFAEHLFFPEADGWE